ncbi:SigE family RNA polymerase sigma factor [Nonomuraea jiangxiensis]|uniref:RNA polymerase sigma-70 factor, sigma-E family n=1 Tax=Nonomuraea jiangxiensis TaxID=633440 RepID=A0A1G9VX54_9ACTN|nr:SigE family RNA polymerase sigma factor [Nonomuraea jiangxiensis]SDM76683.1 RNA polymerase sigma-70 factor, sigma-E family [Nonomuraea jiangxiensis]
MEQSTSFTEFVQIRGPALLRYGLVLTGNPYDAADLAQEALLRLSNSWSRVRKKHDPEGFVRITMARLHISVWRRRRREHLVAQAPDKGVADADIARFDGEPGLWHLVTGLPPRQRAVIVLRYYCDLSDEEIAQALGVSKGTVRSQAARALDKLQTAWNHDDHVGDSDVRR